MHTSDPEQLAKKILKGETRAIGKGLTLLESSHPEHRKQAEQLLELLLPHSGKSFRLGISGIPGVGKSTFIETAGTEILQSGVKLAVLAVDPSSPVHRGSILGDKTRMQNLACHPKCFIRPSPTGGAVGGVARKTRESILLMEAAGFEWILVETVGVGQSEYTVASMVDLFAILQVPGSCDELQGIKKGILELADLIVINKADGKMQDTAKISALQLQKALQLLGRSSQVPIMLCSSIEKNGITEIIETLKEQFASNRKSGATKAKRRAQSRHWFEQELHYGLESCIRENPAINESLDSIYQKVEEGQLTASTGARLLLDSLLQSP